MGSGQSIESQQQTATAVTNDIRLLTAAVSSVGTVFAIFLTSLYYARRQNNNKTPVLSKDEWRKFQLVKKDQISHNTALYRFELPSDTSSLCLPIGQHVSARAVIDGKDVMRSYTPTSLPTDLGFFDLVVKSYPQGLLSKHFGEMVVGDFLEFRGPKGSFNYTPNMCRAIGMIAGGTGITPMLQIIHAILTNPNDKTLVSLIFGNVTEEDILLRDQLDELSRQHKQFSVYYVLNKPPQNWSGGVGFVTKDIIKSHCPAPASDIKILYDNSHHFAFSYIY